MAENQSPSAETHEKPICFAIMPISDPEGYIPGHFKHVYEDIIFPACQEAGFNSLRGDEVKQSNLIHLDILQRLLEAPMAICDLSARNPNVLFELALRQAFDKPVALIREVGTPEIFDISPFRYTEYRKERTYHEVLEDQKAIAATVRETFESHSKGQGINSIVKLLALSRSAAIPEMGPPEAIANFQQLILSELSQLKDEIRSVRRETRPKAWLTATYHKDSTLDKIDLIRSLLSQCNLALSEPSDENIKEAINLFYDCHKRYSDLRERFGDLSEVHKVNLLDLESQLFAVEKAINKFIRPTRLEKE
jgi:hypothetical protein